MGLTAKGSASSGPEKQGAEDGDERGDQNRGLEKQAQKMCGHDLPPSQQTLGCEPVGI